MPGFAGIPGGKNAFCEDGRITESEIDALARERVGRLYLAPVLLVGLVAGFLAPVPILMLHIVEALVQAYIFGMLALIYVAGGIQSQQLRQQKME